jgi:2'-5' RNA ligase
MDGPYYRPFIGLPLQVDQPFLRARDSLMEALGGERISWTQPENYHVTLRFLGDTEPSAVEKIAEALRAGVDVPRQKHLEIAGLGSFGPRKRPRVLWLGFENQDIFQELRQQVDRVLKWCGIPLEEQTFRAHLTLGRIRSLNNPDAYYHTVRAMEQDFYGPVLLDRLIFFRSILGTSGPEYHVLEELLFRP